MKSSRSVTPTCNGHRIIILSILLLSPIFFTSCAKDHTCNCYEKPGDPDPYTATPIPDSKRSTAKEVCDNLNELASSRFPEAYCELD